MLKLFLYRTIEFFGGKFSKKKEIDCEFGEMLVSSKGETEITLPELPRIIEVKFKNSHHPIPCDTHHDKLTWTVRKHHHQYQLIIKWHVSTLREIDWIIYF